MFDVGEIVWVFKDTLFSTQFFKGTVGSVMNMETVDGEVLGMKVKDYLITVRLKQEGWDILIDTRKNIYHLISVKDLELLVKSQMNIFKDLLRKINIARKDL